MKRFLLLIFLAITFIGYTQEKVAIQGFLRAEGQKIVDADGKNVILRGIGLGGHMLQEGYMLKVPFTGQQYVFKEHITKLIGKKATEQFYTRWLANHTQKADIDSLKRDRKSVV